MFDMRKMRSGAKVVLWIVLTAFLLTIFILWGAQMSFNKSNPDTVARIGKTDILYADVSKLWQEKVQQLLDKGQKVSDAREKELKKEALNEIIEKNLMLGYAKKINVAVSDEEVQQSIMGIQSFQGAKGFDKQRYLQILNDNRLTPEEFEFQQRQMIILAKVKNFLTASIKMSDDEIKNYFIKRNRTVSAHYADFSYSLYTGALKIDEDRMKDYYAMHKNTYTKPERVKAAHILIISNGAGLSLNATSEEVALKLATERQARAKRGESFSALAKKYSQDPGSKDKGGELGWFERGKMVPEFESAAFALKPGEISRLVKTQYGYHILKSEGKDAGFEPTYKGSRDLVLKAILKEDGMKIAYEKAFAFKEALKSGELFDKAALKAGARILNAFSFTKDSKLDSIKSQSFADSVLELNLGEVSDIITGDNGFYIAKLSSEKPSAFNKVRFTTEYEATQDRLRLVKLEDVYKALSAALRKEEEVKIYEKNL